MTTWYTRDYPTKEAFLAETRKCADLVVVTGAMGGRFGPQSLPTVLQEFGEVCVRGAGWAVILTRTRRGAKVFCAKCKSKIGAKRRSETEHAARCSSS